MYNDPKSVLSPKGRIKSVEVIFDKGPKDGSWSVARLTWDNLPNKVGIRWNGDRISTKGLPQARGNPTWFVVPDELADAVLNAARQWERLQQDDLLESYRQMAADKEREAEADDWTEGLIGDAN